MNKKFKILTPIAAVSVVAAIITSAVFASPQIINKSRLENITDPIKPFGDPKNIELKTDAEKVEKILKSESSNKSNINGFISKSAINTSNRTSTNSAVNPQSKNHEWFLNTKFWEDLNFDFIGVDEESKQKDDKKKAEKSKLDAKSESKRDYWYNNTEFWEKLDFDFIASDHNSYKTETKVEIEKIKEIIEEKEKAINSVTEVSSEENKIKEKSVDDLEKMLAELEKRLFGSFRDAVIAKENIDKEISNLEKNTKDNESKLNEYINKREEAGEKLTKENDEYFAYKKVIEELQEKLKKLSRSKNFA
ncbi:hypothetical protein [Mycoplasmopsis agalactiae]|uniref:Uncharacterized protein n=1 Tax=Mycoplasmopsis agalactiae TaxID=2110 RepID=D3VQR0_MYCAA|nr:hypothetical protein [Mycoplasmopsis agalactiae]KAB6718541.1 hypothetical protein E4L58_02260 [Mycoplasmopsis agalactiae]CBH40655.1 Hypothetical protein MAGa4430 [Mycoplasmopsis agalactiae]